MCNVNHCFNSSKMRIFNINFCSNEWSRRLGCCLTLLMLKRNRANLIRRNFVTSKARFLETTRLEFCGSVLSGYSTHTGSCDLLKLKCVTYMSDLVHITCIQIIRCEVITFWIFVRSFNSVPNHTYTHHHIYIYIFIRSLAEYLECRSFHRITCIFSL